MRAVMRLFAARAMRAERRGDPAPSLWSYRYQRMMLTPMWRRMFRYGTPAILAAMVASGWLAVPSNRVAIADRVAATVDSVRNRDAFMVRSMAVTGAGPALTDAITARVDLALPVTSFAVDLGAIRASVVELTAVAGATVAIEPGGRLVIAVEERQPVAVWRQADGLRLIDGDGVATGMIADRADRADLPLIAGDGAQDAIPEALALFETAAPLREDVRGLVRMGERRWDLVLRGDRRVLLPEDGAVAALERVLALDAAQDVLRRDVAVVDMRLPGRPTLRLTGPAINVIRTAHANGIEPPTVPVPASLDAADQTGN